MTINGFGGEASTPLQIPGASDATELNPNFGGPETPYPGTAAGWFNGSPPTLPGAVHDTLPETLGTFVGRFSDLGDPWDSPTDQSRISAAWNQGIGTPGESEAFLINWISSPATLGLFTRAGLRNSSRRRT